MLIVYASKYWSFFFYNFDNSNLIILTGLKISFFFFSFLTIYDKIVYDRVVKILHIVLCFTPHSNRIIFNNCIATMLYNSTIVCRIEKKINFIFL